MKKLGNGGWGLSTMIGFIVVFFIFIIIIAVLSSKYNKEHEEERILYETNIINYE